MNLCVKKKINLETFMKQQTLIWIRAKYFEIGQNA